MTVVDRKDSNFFWGGFVCYTIYVFISVLTDYTFENPNRDTDLCKVTNIMKRKHICRGQLTKIKIKKNKNKCLIT